MRVIHGQTTRVTVTKCKSHYSVGELVTIDEKLEKFRGNCPFRQYIASKPGKYGMKSTQMKRWQFLKSLAMDLMKEYRGERAACSHLSRELRTKLKRRITSPAREPEEKRPKFQGRCAICPRSKDRKTKYMCQKCEKFLCLQHVIPLCEECVCA